MLRLSILLFFTVFFSFLYAQTPELVIQTGHQLAINDMEYSPDGKIVASCSEDNTIKLWEIATGKEMQTLYGHSKAVNDIAFSPDSKTLISVGDDRKVIIWEVETGKMVKTINEHKNRVLSVDYSPKGDYFATAGKDKVVLLHNVSSGKIKELYEFKSEVNRIKFLNSGDYLYTETDKLLSRNAFFSIPQGKMVTWVPGGGGTSISFDAADEKFLVGRVNYGTPMVSIIKDWNMISDWKKSKEPLWKSFFPYNFQDTTGDYKIFSFKSQDNYDINKVESESVGAVSTESNLSAFFSKDGRDDIIAANKFGEILFWKYDDIKFYPRTANPYARLNEKMDNMYATPYKVIEAHKSPIIDLIPSKDGKYLFSSAKNGEMKLWDVGLERNIQTFTNGKVYPMYAVAFGQDSKTVVISTGIKDRYIIDLATMEVLDHFENEYAIERFAYSKDKTKALVAYYNSSFFHLMDMRDKSILRTFKGHLGEITSLKFTEDETQVISTATEGKQITWDLTSGEIVNNELAATKPGVSEANGSSLKKEETQAILTSSSGKYNLTHQNKVTSYGYTPDDKYAFTSSMDGALALWDPVSGENIARIMVTRENEVIALTNDFYFMASKDALKSIAFKYKGKMYPFEQFDFQFNRPDILLERIGYANSRLVKAYKVAYKKRRVQLGIPEDATLNFNTPDISLNLAELPRSTSSRSLTFKVSGQDEIEELRAINIKINGVPVLPISITRKEVEKQVEIDLSEGNNTLEVSLLNAKGVSSLSQYFEVKYIPKTPVKKDLYLVTVGVSNYENEDFNLTYASKDAKDLAELFSSQNQFENVYHLNYLNEEATPENVKTTRERLEQSKIDDHVIFFFAGHGLLNRELDYFLAMHHIDFNNPGEGGMAYEDVEKLLSYIPSRNKLILIDACHSGEVEKDNVVLEEGTGNTPNARLTSRGFSNVREKTGLSRILGYGNLFKFMRSQFADLRENTGTIAISSAGGAEYALESADWKNGVFTYYLKEGMINNGADLNGDGKIYASEMQKYLSEKVYEATDGKQQPTTRVANLNHDILIKEY
ncbi:caspase family protein [Ekhidna sp.]|uniref:caspase family protein n=1 Tax=Ekhidna sp. TaxID=2608089 RepID=UPI0032985AC0